MIIRQSTAIDIPVGPFLDSTDGVTAETALTITQPDIRLSKNGAAFAQKSAAQTAAHMENGYYSVNLSTTDTDTIGRLRIHVNETGALPVFMEFQVVEEAIYDAMFTASATGLLPANVTQFNGVAATSASGRPEVNTTHAAGVAWASGAITAASIASSAISAAKIATSAITADKIAANAITDTKIATGAFTAAKFAAGALDAVWSTATRLLTAGTNIVLAKGTGVTGFNDLSAAQVNAEVDTALADYDAPTKAELDAAIAALQTLSRRNTAQGGGASTITLDTGASASDDYYNGRLIVILEGTGADVPIPERTRRITDYVGSTRVATVDSAWATQPDATTVFLIIGAE